MQIRGRIDAGDVLLGYRLHHVDLTGEKGRDPRGRVTDRCEDRLLDIGVNLAPIIQVTLENRLHTRIARFQPERSRAVGFKRRLVLYSLALIDRPLSMVCDAPFFTHDVPARKYIRQNRVWRIGDEVECEMVNLV